MGPSWRATMDRNPSAPTTTRAPYISRFPFPVSRAVTPPTAPPSYTRPSTFTPSRTTAPAVSAAVRRIVSNRTRGSAKLNVSKRPVTPLPLGATTFIPVRCAGDAAATAVRRSEEHTSELQSRLHLVCRLLLEKKKKNTSSHWLRTDDNFTTGSTPSLVQSVTCTR